LSKEVLNHAAARAVRARAVGLNDFMIHKVVRVATILNAGTIQVPNDIEGGPVAQRTAEQSRIPLYLGAQHWGELYEILDYEDWNTVSFPSIMETEDIIRVQVNQSIPLRTALHRAFYARDSINLRGTAFYANHYDLYMERLE
jgi:hypothetical protein